MGVQLGMLEGCIDHKLFCLGTILMVLMVLMVAVMVNIYLQNIDGRSDGSAGVSGCVISLCDIIFRIEVV